jgi:hypothetical protein
MNICEQAEAYRLLLLMGVVEKSEIISWADGIITTQDKAPDWLLDVSLAENEKTSVIESKLRDLPGEWSRLGAVYAALDRFAEEFQIKGRFTSREAAGMLQVWADSIKGNVKDWREAMMPGWLLDEVPYGNATDQQVVESIDACIAYFAEARKVG